MNDREYALRVLRRVGMIAHRDPAFSRFVSDAIRRRLDVEDAAARWTELVAEREEAAARPGGLGRWTADWVECRRCKLCETRRNVVFGRGSVPADVLLIGEGPGTVEDETGEPFRGPSGRILDRALRTIFEPRRVSYYVTNLVGCMPPGLRDPKTPEVDACQDRLDQTVQDVQPWVVVTLGAQPLRQLLVERVGSTRGEVLHWDRHGDVHLIPTWHPAFILRSEDGADRMRELREDLTRAAVLVDELRSVLF